MGRKITKLPDSFDPVALIKKKACSCPLCGGEPIDIDCAYGWYRYCDRKGINHEIRESLNKYRWECYEGLTCSKCGCEWSTGLHPADYKLFEIEVDKDSAAIRTAVNEMLDKLKLNVKLRTLTDIDLQEIQDRFGDYVRFVVEDMLDGEDKRFLDNAETTEIKGY